ncbi:MAG: DUF3568 family protein [Phycisphaerales bacterium]|nr:DUF3568 family protein [Phycisphaerales bacterium]
MNSTTRFLGLCALLGASVTTLGGCLAVAAAAGTGVGVAYVMGDLEVTFDAAPPAVAEAGKGALEELGVTVISSASTSVDGEVVGRTAQDKKITIKIKALGENSSKSSIRVGTFGDEAVSMSVYEKMKARLGG